MVASIICNVVSAKPLPASALQHHIPDATVSPAAELPKNRIPVAELLRQIAPRRAGPHQPKRRVHHTAMVARRTASATDQKRFEIRPLIIGQQSANQGCPPQRAALNQFSIPASIDLSTRPSGRVLWRLDLKDRASDRSDRSLRRSRDLAHFSES